MLDPSATIREVSNLLESAPDGASVRLRPGRYSVSFHLTRSLALVADGEPGSALIDVEDDSAVIVSGGECRVFGLRLTSRRQASDMAARFHPGAVEIEEGSLLLEECVIQGWSNGVVSEKAQTVGW